MVKLSSRVLFVLSSFSEALVAIGRQYETAWQNITFKDCRVVSFIPVFIPSPAKKLHLLHLFNRLPPIYVYKLSFQADKLILNHNASCY